jgi:hypothetical protein
VQRHDLDVGIDRLQRRLRGFDLHSADRVGAVEDLPLQVGEVDLVAVGDSQLADTRRSEIERGGAAEPARADYQRMCRSQPLLSFDPDLGEKDMAAVAEELLVFD